MNKSNVMLKQAWGCPGFYFEHQKRSALPTLSRWARGADSTKESNAMTRDITPAGSPATRAVDESFAEVRASFDRFCCGRDRGARDDEHRREHDGHHSPRHAQCQNFRPCGGRFFLSCHLLL